MSFKEPGEIDVFIITALGYSIGKSFYRNYVESLNLKGDERVVDYGSGSGILAKYIARKLLVKEGHLTCVDISKKWMHQIKKKLKKYPNVDFKLGRINDVAVKDNSYDVLVIHYVLHDIEPHLREETLKLLVGKLKNGGKLFIREPLADKHGIKSSEIKLLMTNAGLKEIKRKLTKNILLGNMTEAVYQK